VPAPADSALDLVDVSAGWGGRPALSGLSLTLAPGRRIGVVGPSGSGKSTLASLLLRFVDPVSGEVRLGGVDLPHLALDDVRRTVGLVDDDPHVFASTVAENIRLARPGATDDEVDAALREAGLAPWLDGLADGLATRLGDGAAAVSGGERARLAVARSLLADQRVLVLDEPTAHLDHATAEQLAAQVLAVDGDRAVVWITHERVGLEHVDEVVELPGDRAAGIGASRGVQDARHTP
jgi:ATP-binding cassette subfamily C protein CydCD